MLKDYEFIGVGGSMIGESGYVAASGTRTYLLRFNTGSYNQTLQDQPLTLLVLPPVLEEGDVQIPLADHPAIIAFQPKYTAKMCSGEAGGEDNDWIIIAELSPFTISVSYYGSDYWTVEKLRGDLMLVMEDGTLIPVQGLGEGYSSGKSFNEKFDKGRVSYKTHFKEIMDSGAVTAIRLGDMEIPLAGEK